MDFLSHLLDAPLSNVLIVAGLLFLGIGVVGKIVGKIEPDKTGRILSALLGIVLLFAGVSTHVQSDNKTEGDSKRKQAPTSGLVSATSESHPGTEPNFAGLWQEIDPQGKDAGNPMRLKIVQNGPELMAYISYTGLFSDRPFFNAALSGGTATASLLQSCALSNQTSGYNYENPGVNILNITLRGSILIYEQDTKWTSPCGGHPIGIEQSSKQLKLVSR
jgi:hypothetical protein